jgi:hypothetical protein
MVIRKKTTFFIMIILMVYFGLKGYPQEIKRYEFAGSFYPRDESLLSAMVDNFLEKAETTQIKGALYGVISPHAGYIYSGQIAAYSYKILENKKIDTIILLGPSHRYYFEGVSIYPAGKFECPLGMLNIDEDIVQEFKDLRFVTFNSQYFYSEHSLEVQLPFIIKAISEVEIVPILFGKIDYSDMEKLANKLSLVSQKKRILVIVSTDLSHYHPYEEAVKIDRDTINFIRKKKAYSLWVSQELGELRACGIYPLITFLIYSEIKKADIKILKYANSGDTTGDKSKVVGYLSAVAYKKSESGEDEIKSKNKDVKNESKKHLKGENMDEYSLSREEKLTLLRIARDTLNSYLKNGKIPDFKVDSDNLKEKRGAFVTLKKNGQLRGCIGRIVGDTALYKVIANVAIDSALNDPRFPPVQYSELKDIEIEISVLTPFTKVENLDEIEVGKHGLMIRKGFYSGLLLPQVPVEYGWDRETFLQHTSLKAGLPPTAYKDKDAVLYKFSAIVFSESEFKNADEF